MSSSGGTGHGRGGKGKKPSGGEGQPAKKRARGHNGPVLVEEIDPKAAYSAVLQYYCTGNAPEADDKTMRTLWLCLDYEINASPRLKALSALIYNHPDTMFHLVNWLLLNHDTLGPAPAPASCTEPHRDHTRAPATTHNAHAPPPPSVGQGLLGQMFGVFGFDPLMGPMPVSSSSSATFGIPPRSASQPSHDTLRACLPLLPPPSQYRDDASVAVGGGLQCGGGGAAAVGAGAGIGRNGGGGPGTGPQASIDVFVEYGSPRLGRLLQYVWPHLQTRIDVRGLAAVGRNVLYHTDVLPPGLISESLSLLEETGRKQYGKRSLVGVLCDAVRKDQTLHTEGGGGMPVLAHSHAPTHAPTHTHTHTAVREMMVALLGAVAEGRTQEAVWAAVPAGLKTRVLSSVKQWTPSAISVVADAAVGCDTDVLTAVQALSSTDHSALLDLAGALVRSSRRTSKSLLLVWLSLQGQKLCDVLGVNDATGLVMARILGAVLDDDEDRVDDIDDRALKACGAPLLTALLHALMRPRGGLWHGKERDVMDTLHRVVRCMAAMDELECPLRKDLGLCQATIDFIVTVMRCVNDKSSAEKAFDFRRGGHDPDRDDFTGIARLINSALEAVLSICSASQVLPRAWFQKVLDSFEFYEKMIRDEHEDCGYECAYGRPFRLLTRFGELRQRIGAFYDIVEASDTSRPTTPAMTLSATFHPAATTASTLPPKHDRPHTRSGGGRRGGASAESHAPVAAPSAAGGQAQVHTDSNDECIICYARGVVRLECCNRPVACVNNICASCLWRKLFTPDENQAYTCLLCRGDTRLRIYARRAGEEANTELGPGRSTAGDMGSIRRAAGGGGGIGGGGGGGGGSGGPGGGGRGANSANMMFGPPPDFLFPGPSGGPGGSSTVIRVGLPMGLGDGPNGEPNPLSVLRMVGEAISRGPPPFMSSRTQTNPHGHSRSSPHRPSRGSRAARGGYGGDASIMSEFGSYGEMHGGGRRRDDGSEDSDEDSRGGASGDDHSEAGSDMSDEDDDHMFG